MIQRMGKDFSLLAGSPILDSGASEPWTEADVEEIRAAVRKRLKKRRRAHGATPKD